jgi:hypothetical protein
LAAILLLLLLLLGQQFGYNRNGWTVGLEWEK